LSSAVCGRRREVRTFAWEAIRLVGSRCRIGSGRRVLDAMNSELPGLPTRALPEAARSAIAFDKRFAKVVPTGVLCPLSAVRERRVSSHRAMIDTRNRSTPAGRTRARGVACLGDRVPHIEPPRPMIGGRVNPQFRFGAIALRQSCAASAHGPTSAKTSMTFVENARERALRRREREGFRRRTTAGAIALFPRERTIKRHRPSEARAMPTRCSRTRRRRADRERSQDWVSSFCPARGRWHGLCKCAATNRLAVRVHRIVCPRRSSAPRALADDIFPPASSRRCTELAAFATFYV
jgi:hypothetical protein